MEVSKEVWGELLGTLKSIGDYLEKQDAEQTRAKIDKPPKAQEYNKPIKGAESSGFKPGEGVAKAMDVSVSANPLRSEQQEISDSGGGLLKEENKAEEEASETSESEKGKEDDGDLVEVSDEEATSEKPGKDETDEEIKSLFKDIKSALLKSSDVDAKIEAAIKKSIGPATTQMLRRMGITPTRSDVVKLGIDSNAEVKKSEDSPESVDKLNSEQANAAKGVINLSKKSYPELGVMREKLGHFDAFPRS